ncbi:MAG: right-handed parallel beta-helix repeat-containing protein [Spirochaetales bacterium]
MSTIYVSTAGNDENPGSTDAPLASLAEAVARAREKAFDVIELGDGVYHLARPVSLGPADSGLSIVAARGATPVLDGGVTISQWSNGSINGKAALVADVSELLSSLGRPFHSLFVGGKRRSRSRFPLAGYFALRPSSEEPLSHAFRGTKTPELADPGTVPEEWSLRGAELRVLHKWVDERMPIDAFDASTGRFECRYRSIQRMTGETSGWKKERAFIENAREAVTEPGQWYLDEGEGLLYVIPETGETADNLVATVPIALQLLRLEGEIGAPAENISVRGITFRHTDWIAPVGDWGYRFDPYLPKNEWRPRDSFDHFIANNGFSPDELYAAVPQAAHNTPGALHLFAAAGCTFEGCRFEHLGFYAVELGDGCVRNVIDQCSFRDIGGGAVNADGGNRQETPERHLRENVISRNDIEGVGRVFLASCGILIAFGARNRVVANHIRDLRYTGISCGWSWAREHQIARENLIAYNHIHGIKGPDLLSDLGGIYILGIQPGTVLRGNKIHDIEYDAYGGSGIYTDAATANVLVEDNLIYDIKGAGITVNHHNCENVYRRNVIAFVQDAPVAVMRNPTRFWDEFGDIGRAGTIVSNIMISASVPYRYAVHPDEFTDAELARMSHCDANIICGVLSDARQNRGTPPEHAAVGWEMKPVITWKRWVSQGQDRTSTFVDPGFNDVSARDFTLAPETLGATVLASALWHPCTAGSTQPPLDAGGANTVRGEENGAVGIPDANANKG